MGGDMMVFGQGDGGKRGVRRVAQQGFTLVEMAIVLVIIGLIIGGILKGQEVVNSGRLKIQVSQIDSIKAAVNTFVDQYNYYPGDFKASGTLTPNGVTTFDGDENGFVAAAGSETPYVDSGAMALADEPNKAWVQLSIANLLSGIVNSGGVAAPNFFQAKVPNAYIWFADFAYDQANGGPVNKMVRIQRGKDPSVALTSANAPAVREADAASMDTKYDDGVPGTGNILAGTASDAANCCNGACNSHATAYGISVSNGNTLGGSQTAPYCVLLFQVE
jgi:prepilin-type N-terminal cleavage/methylation domain-containing protein